MDYENGPLNEDQQALIAFLYADSTRATQKTAAANLGAVPLKMRLASELVRAVKKGRALPELVETVLRRENGLHYATFVSRLPMARQRQLIAKRKAHSGSASAR